MLNRAADADSNQIEWRNGIAAILGKDGQPAGAVFLDIEGGDLVISVAEDGTIIGVEPDGFVSDDRFLLHLTNVVTVALGDRAGRASTRGWSRWRGSGCAS